MTKEVHDKVKSIQKEIDAKVIMIMHNAYFTWIKIYVKMIKDVIGLIMKKKFA